MFPETIFTVVTLVDRYIALKDVPLSKLQLVGAAALFMSAKFEETYQVPPLKQIISACASQYTREEILAMEADIIKTFNFELIVNSSFKFFSPLAKIAGL
jgi:G2/mitotic-specific cyclin 3/4